MKSPPTANDHKTRTRDQSRSSRKKSRYFVPDLARLHGLVLDWRRQRSNVCHLSRELVVAARNSGCLIRINALQRNHSQAIRKSPLVHNQICIADVGMATARNVIENIISEESSRFCLFSFISTRRLQPRLTVKCLVDRALIRCASRPISSLFRQPLAPS